MDELISIIVPIFNGEAVLECCIHSIVNQTYQNIEVIIINDGSTDCTDKICQQWLKKDDRVKYYTQDNAGPGAARNLGLSKADGEYIAFIDGDDFIYPQYIEELYQLIRSRDVSFSCCSLSRWTRGIDIPPINSKPKKRILDQNDALKSILYRKEIIGIPFCKLFKRELIIDERFPEDIKIAEDFLFIFRILKKCTQIAYVNSPLYIYYQNGNSITHTQGVREYKQVRSTFYNHVYKELKSDFPDLIPAYVSKMFIYYLKCLVVTKINQWRQPFFYEIIAYIKKYCGLIMKDRENKRSNRILALACTINIKGTVYLCKGIWFVMMHTGKQIRRML